MDQVKPYYQKPMDRNLAVCVSYATFAWHFTADPAKKSKRKRHMYILFHLFSLSLSTRFNSSYKFYCTRVEPDSNGPEVQPLAVKSQSCLINIDLLVTKVNFCLFLPYFLE